MKVTFMNRLPLVLGLLAASPATLFFTSCGGEKTPDPAPVLQLGFKESGGLWTNSTGPDIVQFSRTNDDFKIDVGPFQKSPWLTAKGKIKTSKESNAASFDLTFTSDRPFELQVLGLATKDVESLPDEATIEKIQMPAGEKSLKLDRFIIYVYE